MSKMKLLTLCVILMLNVILTANEVIALEQITHSYLNEIIVSQNKEILNTYLNFNLGFSKGVDEIINGKRVITWLKEGGIKEDEPFYTRSFAHFHDPLKPWEIAGYKGIFKSSIVWAQDQAGMSPIVGGDQSWKKARDSFYKGLTGITKTDREKNLADTFRALGQVMHLVQDTSVPAHVRNDGHVYINLAGIKIGTYHYEIWAKYNHSKLNLSPSQSM